MRAGRLPGSFAARLPHQFGQVQTADIELGQGAINSPDCGDIRRTDRKLRTVAGAAAAQPAAAGTAAASAIVAAAGNALTARCGAQSGVLRADQHVRDRVYAHQVSGAGLLHPNEQYLARPHLVRVAVQLSQQVEHFRHAHVAQAQVNGLGIAPHIVAQHQVHVGHLAHELEDLLRGHAIEVNVDHLRQGGCQRRRAAALGGCRRPCRGGRRRAGGFPRLLLRLRGHLFLELRRRNVPAHNAPDPANRKRQRGLRRANADAPGDDLHLPVHAAAVSQEHSVRPSPGGEPEPRKDGCKQQILFHAAPPSICSNSALYRLRCR